MPTNKVPGSVGVEDDVGHRPGANRERRDDLSPGEDVVDGAVRMYGQHACGAGILQLHIGEAVIELDERRASAGRRRRPVEVSGEVYERPVVLLSPQTLHRRPIHVGSTHEVKCTGWRVPDEAPAAVFDDLRDLTRCDIDGVDLGAGIGAAVFASIREECDPVAIGVPRGRWLVEVPRSHASGFVAAGRVDQMDMDPPIVGPPLVVESIGDLVDASRTPGTLFIGEVLPIVHPLGCGDGDR